MVIAGEATAAPPLLSRQTVVAGLSDGAVRVFEREDSPVHMQLPDATAPLPPLFLQTVAAMPVRQAHPLAFTDVHGSLSFAHYTAIYIKYCFKTFTCWLHNVRIYTVLPESLQ